LTYFYGAFLPLPMATNRRSYSKKAVICSDVHIISLAKESVEVLLRNNCVESALL